jgi:putative DNA primase/helicase
MEGGKPCGQWKSGPRAGQVDAAPFLQLLPLREALARSYSTDAHAAPYSIHGAERSLRVNQGGLQLLLERGRDLTFHAVFVDVDGKGHGDGEEADPRWSAQQIAKVRETPLWQGCGWYLTRGGFRLVWELPGLGRETFLGMLPRLVDALHKAGIPRSDVDGHGIDSFKDFGHIYRLPFVRRNGQDQRLPASFDRLGLLDLSALPEVSEDDVAAAFAGVDTARAGTGPTQWPDRVITGEKPGGAGRETWLVRYAGKLRSDGHGDVAVRDYLTIFNQARCVPPKDAKDLDRIAGSSRRWRDEAAEARRMERQDLPTISLGVGKLPELVEESCEALQRGNVYQRGGLLVGVHTNPLEGSRIETWKPAGLRLELARQAEWVRLKQKDDDWEEVPADPPKDLVSAVMEAGSWPLRPLAGLVEAPTLRPDGSVLEVSGYDQETGLFLQPSGSFPDVPSEPSDFQVRSALAALQEVFEDFPFQHEHHRSGALAGLITAVVRPAIEGPAPIFIVDATTPSSGKGKIVNVCSLVATGRGPGVQPMTKEEELEKRITSMLMRDERVILFDNVTGSLGGPSLDALLTADTWVGRLLGASSMPRLRNRAALFATGNNVTIRGDLSRRAVRVFLDPGMERPEQRQGFRHPDLEGWVSDNRGRLVVAALTVVRGYLASGETLHGGVGSYRGWDRLVRGTLLWLGLPDPLQSQEELRELADISTAAWGTVLEGLTRLYPSSAFTVGDLLRKLQPWGAGFGDGGEDSGILEALQELAGNRKGDLDARRAGYVFRKYAGRIVGGIVLQKAGKGKHGSEWKVAFPDRQAKPETGM